MSNGVRIVENQVLLCSLTQQPRAMSSS